MSVIKKSKKHILLTKIYCFCYFMLFTMECNLIRFFEVGKKSKQEFSALIGQEG